MDIETGGSVAAQSLDPRLEAELERALAPYQGLVPEGVLAELREEIRRSLHALPLEGPPGIAER